MQDLIIEIENEQGSIVRKLQVNARLESDHLLIELWIGKEGRGEKIKREKEKKKEFRLKWVKK